MTNRQAAGKPVKTRFLSLTWRSIIFSSILLTGIAVTLTGISYYGLQRQHQEKWDTAYRQYLLQFEGLIDESIKQEQQIGSIITAFSGIQEAIVQGSPRQLRQAFDKHWPSLQIDFGLEVARFFSPEGILLGKWPMEDNKLVDRRVISWVWQVKQEDQPLSIVDCSQTCMQYTLVPVLANGSNAGILLIGKSLADVLLGFRKGSATDVGLFVTNQENATDLSPSAVLASKEWRKRLLAVTSPDHTLPLLARMASKVPDNHPIPASTLIRQDGKDFAIRLFPLDKTIDIGHAAIIFITDISQDLASIRTETTHILLTGGAGLIGAEILLFLLLWAPMSRLRRNASALPLLADNAFTEARKVISASDHDHLWDDESDIMAQASIALADRLELLQQEASQQREKLQKRAQELSHQKELVTSLLNTANAIILTQNGHGEITSINRYGLSLLGYREEEIVGIPFVRLVSSEDFAPDLLTNLNDVARGKLPLLHQDLAIRGRTGSIFHIDWYHSHPQIENDSNTLILSVGHDITERRVAEARLSWLASHDPLTGLLNRRTFQILLKKEIEESHQAQGKHGALLFLDIDQFKDVNDSSGHQTGDILLRDVANTLLKMVDGIGVIGRLGGDEFGIMLTSTTREQAEQMTQQIVNRLGQITLPASGRMYRISASIGIAQYPEHGANVKTLLANADLAMYQAKEQGRGRWHLYSTKDNVNQRVFQRVFWREKIEQALHKDLFELYYQPIMHIPSRTISHFEALLRLHNDDGTVAAPSTFIIIAENTGMIHRIDQWVIDNALRTLHRLNSQGADISFSINISAHTLSSEHFLDMLSSKIKQAGVDPTRLILEVTETAAVEDFASARKRIEQIQSLGCRFALDDFGVGFSSFYSLKQLPVDLVKIDGSFIKDLTHNKEDQVLVHSLAQAIQGFRNTSIAEFVASEDIFKLIREFGIDYAQGYFIGEPMPLDAICARYIDHITLPDDDAVMIADDKVTHLHKKRNRSAGGKQKS